jgi:hypothetical protein
VHHLPIEVGAVIGLADRVWHRRFIEDDAGLSA